MLNDYLQYELYHSIGAYGVASEGLMQLEERMNRQRRAESGDYAAERDVLEHDRLLRVTRLSRQYNEQLVRERHYADRLATGDSLYRVRHPIPTDLPLTLRERFDFDTDAAGITARVRDARENPWASPLAWAWVLNFYDAAIAAIALQLSPGKLEDQARNNREKAKRVVWFADSIVWPRERRREVQISTRERWLRGKRFVDRRHHALEKLPGVPRHTPPRSDDAIEFIYRLTTDHLGSGYGSVPMFVISALAEAHLSMHAVEGWRSMALQDHAALAAGQLGQEGRWLWKELDRCIVLYTFVYSASRSAPWMFAENADQCQVIFWHFDECWQHGVPARALWISAQTSLLALHRRAYSHALKGDRTAAYNDYHKLQRQIRNARRRVEAAPVHVAGALDFLALLEARAHQNIGELYRAEHAQRPALKHLATALDRLDAMPVDGEVGEVLTNSRWYIQLQMSRGKASFEMGRHKDCLRWHLGAWRAFLKLLASETQMEQGTDAIDKAITWLEEIRFEPELRKHEVKEALRPIMDQLDRIVVPERLGALAAEILLRLGHVLFVLNLGASRERSGTANIDSDDTPPGSSTGTPPRPPVPSGSSGSDERDGNPPAGDAESRNLPLGPGSRPHAPLPDAIADTLSFVFLKKAAECDPRSTLVGTDLLKSNLRIKGVFGATDPAALSTLRLPKIAPVARQWPHGVDDYERIAATAEYLTLIALDPDLRPQEDDYNGLPDLEREDRRDEVTIARDLLLSFFLHTDSINVRKAQTHHFLMKGPTSSRAPCRDEEPTGAATEGASPGQADGEQADESQREAQVREVLLDKYQQVTPQPAIEFVCMRRYSSAFPLLPRPSAFRAHGGGYLVRLHPGKARPNDQPFGIAVDPGPDFIENLYRTGFSLSDIKMIVVTHDHVDHLNSLESVLSLMHYQSDLQKQDASNGEKHGESGALAAETEERAEAAGAEEAPPPQPQVPAPLVYGNASIRARYRTVEKLGANERFKDLSELQDQTQPPGLPEWFKIVAMSSEAIDDEGHLDLSKKPSYGVCFQYQARPTPDGSPSKPELSLAITSDTPAPPDPAKAESQWNVWQETWQPALTADVLITHLSTVPLPELRQMARLDAHDALAPCDLGELSQEVSQVWGHADAAAESLRKAVGQIEEVRGKIQQALAEAKREYLNDPHYLQAVTEQTRVEAVVQCVAALRAALGALAEGVEALHDELVPPSEARGGSAGPAPGARSRSISDTEAIGVTVGEKARAVRRVLQNVEHRAVLHDQLARVATEAEKLALRARHPHRDAETLEEIRTTLEGYDRNLGSRIEFAMWLRSASLAREPLGPTADLVGRVPQSDDPTMNWSPPQEHPYLRGTLAWAQAYRDARERLTDGESGPHGLFVLGELSEELGTVRGTIAGFINETIFMKRGNGRISLPIEMQNLRALTSDVGLRTFVVSDTESYGCAKTLCTTCSLDTDRTPDEIYHRANRISEVCVKGENEGIFYNCADHDPGAAGEERFLEQLERFDVFGR